MDKKYLSDLAELIVKKIGPYIVGAVGVAKNAAREEFIESIFHSPIDIPVPVEDGEEPRVESKTLAEVLGLLLDDMGAFEDDSDEDDEDSLADEIMDRLDRIEKIVSGD